MDGNDADRLLLSSCTGSVTMVANDVTPGDTGGVSVEVRKSSDADGKPTIRDPVMSKDVSPPIGKEVGSRSVMNDKALETE